MANPWSRTWTTGPVARAVGIPTRTLEGWAEQGLVTPRRQRGRTRHGDRRQYGWRDVLTVAVLAELRKILGAAGFRPGGVAGAVAAVMRQDALGLTATVPDTLLVLRATENDELAVEILYDVRTAQLPSSALIVNLTALGRRLEAALRDA